MLGLGFSFFFGKLGVGALIFMLTYIASFAMSWGPVTWVLLSEIFPNSIRSAMSIAVAAQWLANLIVSWTFPMLNDNIALTARFNHGFAYWLCNNGSTFCYIHLENGTRNKRKNSGRNRKTLEEKGVGKIKYRQIMHITPLRLTKGGIFGLTLFQVKPSDSAGPFQDLHRSFFPYS